MSVVTVADISMQMNICHQCGSRDKSINRVTMATLTLLEGWVALFEKYVGPFIGIDTPYTSKVWGEGLTALCSMLWCFQRLHAYAHAREKILFSLSFFGRLCQSLSLYLFPNGGKALHGIR